MARYEKNQNYNGSAEPHTGYYWMGNILLSPKNSLAFIGLEGSPEDMLAELLIDDVTEDVKCFNVQTMTTDISRWPAQNLKLSFELAGPHDEFAAHIIAGLALQAILKLGLDPSDIELEAGSLVNGTQLLADLNHGRVEQLSDYTRPDPMLSQTVMNLHKWALAHHSAPEIEPDIRVTDHSSVPWLEEMAA
jgi:hypothetical protein